LKLTAQGARLADLVRTQFLSLQDFLAGCRAETVDYTVAAGDSLIQWLVIPRLAGALTTLPNTRFATSNLRTNDIVQQLTDGRVDFGVIRKDAIVSPLKSATLGTLTFTLVVPKSLAPRREKLSLADALTHLPFATHTSDGQFTDKLRELTKRLGAELQPKLICQSFPQSLAAVRSGGFASILPTLALKELEPGSYTEIATSELNDLRREIVLAWNARLVSVRPNTRKLIEHLQHAWRI
jgi:DNA-binding transcriptional LysR family regulator